jgi:hypothetical protein
MAGILQDHLDTHVPDPDPEALIFGPDVIGKRTFRREWELARSAAKVDCTFHDLRHVAGTPNATAGASIKEAMARLGHASPAAALRYQHAAAARDHEIASRVDLLIQPQLDRPPTSGWMRSGREPTLSKGMVAESSPPPCQVGWALVVGPWYDRYRGPSCCGVAHPVGVTTPGAGVVRAGPTPLAGRRDGEAATRSGDG